MINTIGPVWDGNEVWLLVAGGATFAAFPEWYATLFSGFYLPLLLILLALIVRGVAFEYRGKLDDAALAAPLGPGDLLAARSCRRCCGAWPSRNIVRGVPLDADHEYTGDLFDLLNPYALLGGLTTLACSSLHGAVFLALKTDGDDPRPGQRGRAGGSRRPRSSSPRRFLRLDRRLRPTTPARRLARRLAGSPLCAGRRGRWRPRGREGWAFAGTA